MGSKKNVAVVGYALLVACGGSGSDGEASAPAGPASNLSTAAASTCGPVGQAPTGFAATCADGAPIPLVPEDGESAFCKDKRFGSLFFQEVAAGGGTPDKRLYFCTSPSDADLFAFGDEYKHVVVAKTQTDTVGFALADGHSYRCFSKENLSENEQRISTRTPLPLNEELCAGFTVVERGAIVKVSIGGQILQMVPITP